MDNDKKILEMFNTIMQSDKRKYVCLSTTANKNNPNFYIGSYRETPETIAANFIFRNDTYLLRIIEMFDGKIERFLVDCEIKNEFTNLVQLVNSYIKKTKITYYKPNDIAIESLDLMISTLFPDAGKLKAGIIGLGNIGSKIALKLIERGANLRVYDLNKNIIDVIVHTLNLIKRGSGKIEIVSSIQEICNQSNLIICCTPGINVIGKVEIEFVQTNSCIIDVGNGSISKEAVSGANTKNINLYSLTPESGYWGYITSLDKIEKQVSGLKTRFLDNGKRLITPGIIGNYGDILVDDVDSPNRIIGVCNGEGDILHDENIKINIEDLYD